VAVARFLAFDLGAESVRAIMGRLRNGVLEVNEISRFPNQPIRAHGSLRWDVPHLWSEMRRALDNVSGPQLESVGVDAWGVDYALLDDDGKLLEAPFHYRDRRTEGMIEAVSARLGLERIYSTTGVQVLPINTLYQLYAARCLTPKVLESATALALIPDLFNFWLTGRLSAEYTIATTTQFVDARTRSWATGLLSALDLPARLLPPIVEPGTVLGTIRDEVSATMAGTTVVAPACHDTASAVASICAGGRAAFISSGTWSLLGTELPAPIVTSTARALNFTNEGGVYGTTRLLKNITGLWLLQSCRRSWVAAGHDVAYADLLAAAASKESEAFRSLIDPDDHMFVDPDDMPMAIVEYCQRTGQPGPSAPPAYARCILESLALKYRLVLESLEALTGRRFDEIRIVGGGSRNRLLNQMTADATGRTVLAGPAEATALGNLALQMLATGAVASLAAAREIIDRSFPVERFEPSEADRWEVQIPRFREYVGRAF
jgi:rhamnulokinase